MNYKGVIVSGDSQSQYTGFSHIIYKSYLAIQSLETTTVAPDRLKLTRGATWGRAKWQKQIWLIVLIINMFQEHLSRNARPSAGGGEGPEGGETPGVCGKIY